MNSNVVGTFMNDYKFRVIGEYTKTYQYKPQTKSTFRSLFGLGSAKPTETITKYFSLLEGKKDIPNAENLYGEVVYYLAEKGEKQLIGVTLRDLEKVTNVTCTPSGANGRNKISYGKCSVMWNLDSRVQLDATKYTGELLDLKTETPTDSKSRVQELGFTQVTAGGKRKRTVKRRVLRKKTRRSSR
jgi:hypothetical protein